MTDDVETIDLRGLKCPLPALFAKRALERAAPGTTILVLADDPLAAIDIPHMCHQEGYEVVNSESADAMSRLRLKRSK
ncbi:MAG TPA: sulfurtransferase TusA family protein [Rhizomicrobium sp.]